MSDKPRFSLGFDQDDRPSVGINMAGEPEGPYFLGRHVHGQRWCWFEPDYGFSFSSRWRWLCRFRHWRFWRARL